MEGGLHNDDFDSDDEDINPMAQTLYKNRAKKNHSNNTSNTSGMGKENFNKIKKKKTLLKSMLTNTCNTP